jgi:hypothetical protein
MDGSGVRSCRCIAGFVPTKVGLSRTPHDGRDHSPARAGGLDAHLI